MKRLILMVVVAAVCVGVVTSCVCSKGNAKSCAQAKCPAMSQAGKSIDQCPIMSKLNLSDAQKVEVQKICDQCSKDGCSKKSCKKMTKDLEKVLTPEQMTQFKAACDEMKGKGGCGMKAKESGCAMNAKKSGCCAKAPEAAPEAK